MKDQNIRVEDVIRDTMSMLQRQGYSPRGRIHQTVFRGIAKFSQDKFDGEYSIAIGERFIQSLTERISAVSDGYIRTNAVAVQRLNRVMEGDLDWRPSKPPIEYADSRFRAEAADYGEYLRNGGKAKSDIRSRMHMVARFLKDVDDSGLTCLSDVTPSCIYESFKKASDKGGFRKCICAFLRYAHRYELIECDLSMSVPTVSRHIPVPTVYTNDEVERIIAAASLSKRCGKRNKAIVLIAARLGLRSCDIANLRFENIRRDYGTIELTQTKTKESLQLPLLPEIRDALDDYIQNERPESTEPRLFLCNCLPSMCAIQPHTVYSIVSRIIDYTGIDTQGRKRGAHALRSSLATALIDEGHTHREVQYALGHKSPDAIKSYIKTDVEHLRGFALPVPEPTGGFAASLESGVRP